MKVTIADVAIRAGVSPTTVSLSFREGSRISEETRRRVLGAAKEIGYVQNQFARRLRLGKSQLIGLVVTEADTPFMADIIAGVERTVSVRGYNVLIFSTGRDISVERQVVASAYELKVEGMIVAACERENEELLRLDRQGFPLVFVDSVPKKDMRCSYVINDVMGIGRLGMQHLISLGHRRILLLNGPYESQHFSSFARLEKAYNSVLKENNIPVDQRLIRYNGLYISHGYAAIDEALNEGPDFTAVFAVSDYVALGVIECLEKHGLKVPDDISVLGIDNIEVAGLGRLGLSTIETYHHSDAKIDMGTLAARMLLDILDNGSELPPNPHIAALTPRLVIRDSCRPI